VLAHGYKFLYCGLVAVLVTHLYYMEIMNKDIDGDFRRSNVGRVTLLNKGKWPFRDSWRTNWWDKNYRIPIQADEEKQQQQQQKQQEEQLIQS
jgi:hypothetical protein